MFVPNLVGSHPFFDKVDRVDCNVGEGEKKGNEVGVVKLYRLSLSKVEHLLEDAIDCP